MRALESDLERARSMQEENALELAYAQAEIERSCDTEIAEVFSV